MTCSALFEVYRQRLTTYKPELILKNQYFKIIRNEKFKIPTVWNNELVKADIINYSIVEEFENRTKYELGMLNIGLGSAKDIKIVFSYDIKGLVSEILKIDKDNELGLAFSNSLISFSPKEENFLLYKGIAIS